MQARLLVQDAPVDLEWNAMRIWDKLLSMDKLDLHRIQKNKSTPPEHRPPLLPQNLDASLSYLSDDELERLAAAVAAQLRSRGFPAGKISSTSAGTKRGASPRPQRKAQSLTAPQVNLIKAAIKAGVKPPALARQFGITKAQIEAALSNA